MALQNQIHIYSLDTSCFYNSREMAIHSRMSDLYVLRSQATSLVEKLEKQVAKRLDEDIEDRISSLKDIVSVYNNMLKHEKQRLYEELEITQIMGGVRNLRPDTLIDRNIISVFESSLTRTTGMKAGELTKDIMIIQTYYFDVIEDIIKRGFYYGNEKYIALTASAGQIRTKKTVFIKEKLWEEYKNTITCGLSMEDINSKGGINVNKYLAYLALSNSATDVWKEFDINKAIVVNDFETLVTGEVDFVDETTYTVERKSMDVPIPHMDGCGIMMPKANNKKSTMVRLPWIKGLLVPFDFHKFIKKKREELCDDSVGIIKDINGKEHDIIKEDIQYILTASQWKMYKYYDSWDDYVEKFIKYGCEACKCNEEEDYICNAKINYQMLQTLTDMKTEEIEVLAKPTVDDVAKLGTDRETMLKILGVVKQNTNKTYLQQALEIYPELLQDTYSREILKQVKKSLVKDAKAGKLFVDGKYTFLIPDLYAFCEWLFLGEENPKGLLNNGEVFCNLYKDGVELDVLRSPHLYREHAVR
ncbi:MAG: RNA dependent RNA polymerase, partial [Peptostreptococcaceae bacterium]